MIVHLFNSTGEAYDATQCSEEVRDGHILLIPSEQVVGLAHTWPVAITKSFGKLHTFANNQRSVALQPFMPQQLNNAMDLAQALGYELR